MYIQNQNSLVVKDNKDVSGNSLVSVSSSSHPLWSYGSSPSIQEGLRAKSPAATGRSSQFGLDRVDLGDSPLVSIVRPAQSLFHVPPSLGRGLSVCQHCPVCLPEALLHFLHILGHGGVISVLGDASSSEPPHLQLEEPGPESHTEETDSSGNTYIAINWLSRFSRFTQVNLRQFVMIRYSIL